MQLLNVNTLIKPNGGNKQNGRTKFSIAGHSTSAL
jgi:hypothetical protein